jgi:hypothetical protein
MAMGGVRTRGLLGATRGGLGWAPDARRAEPERTVSALRRLLSRLSRNAQRLGRRETARA